MGRDLARPHTHVSAAPPSGTAHNGTEAGEALVVHSSSSAASISVIWADSAGSVRVACRPIEPEAIFLGENTKIIYIGGEKMAE